MKVNELFNHELFGGAKPITFENARILRKELTKAEAILWKSLRNRKLAGVKFRRQHPIKQFIVDFYCASKKLAIEIDGAIHDPEDAKEYDENRSHELEEIGIRILRFSNEQVVYEMDEVLNQIRNYL